MHYKGLGCDFGPLLDFVGNLEFGLGKVGELGLSELELVVGVKTWVGTLNLV